MSLVTSSLHARRFEKADVTCDSDTREPSGAAGTGFQTHRKGRLRLSLRFDLLGCSITWIALCSLARHLLLYSQTRTPQRWSGSQKKCSIRGRLPAPSTSPPHHEPVVCSRNLAVVSRLRPGLSCPRIRNCSLCAAKAAVLIAIRCQNLDRVLKLLGVAAIRHRCPPTLLKLPASCGFVLLTPDFSPGYTERYSAPDRDASPPPQLFRALTERALPRPLKISIQPRR